MYKLRGLVVARKVGNKTMKQRFEDKFVVSEDRCWEWVAGKHDRGYGYFYTSDTFSKRKMDYAHRVSIYLYKGFKVPDDLEVLHLCDNPCCVNPEHLSIGTHQDNMDDMIIKDRFLNSNERLTEEDVNLAMSMRRRGVMVKDIAVHFGIDEGHSSRISRGLRKHYNKK